jgi:8-oxo-dGTP pyrophosphatase MutT (NUDIX family)
MVTSFEPPGSLEDDIALEPCDRGAPERRLIGRKTMRRSEAAVAMIRRVQDGQTLWLAQWNPKWRAYHFVGGHRRPEESFRECLTREVGEELGLGEGVDYQVSPAPPIHLEFTDFSQSTRTETDYIMELFGLELYSRANPTVEGNPENCWLTEAEIEAGRTNDGRPVSTTMRRLLHELRGRTEGSQ